MNPKKIWLTTGRWVPIVATVFFALLWVVWWMVAGQVPIQTLKCGHFAVSMSRWWDILPAPLFAVLLFGFFTHPKVQEQQKRDEETFIVMVGIGSIVAIFNLMFNLLDESIRGPDPYNATIHLSSSSAPCLLTILGVCVGLYLLFTACLNSSRSLIMMLGCGLIAGLFIGAINIGLCLGLVFSLVYGLTIYSTHQLVLLLRPQVKRPAEGVQT